MLFSGKCNWKPGPGQGFQFCENWILLLWEVSWQPLKLLFSAFFLWGLASLFCTVSVCLAPRRHGKKELGNLVIYIEAVTSFKKRKFWDKRFNPLEIAFFLFKSRRTHDSEKKSSISFFLFSISTVDFLYFWSLPTPQQMSQLIRFSDKMRKPDLALAKISVLPAKKEVNGV